MRVCLPAAARCLPAVSISEVRSGPPLQGAHRETSTLIPSAPQRSPLRTLRRGGLRFQCMKLGGATVLSTAQSLH